MSSSLIKSVEYNDGVLMLGLGRSGIYHYINVPMYVYNGLITADSMGMYYNVHIRNCYTFTKEEE